MLSFLQSKSSVPNIEEYISLRLTFFRKNPLLARIFFDSLTQTDISVADDIRNIRASLLDFNKVVYSNFLERVELRDGLGREEAMHYFETVQKNDKQLL